MRLKRISLNHYTRVDYRPRKIRGIFSKKLGRPFAYKLVPVWQICLWAFAVGFLLTVLILPFTKVEAYMSAFVSTPAVMSSESVFLSLEPLRAGSGSAAGKLTLRHEIENYIRVKFGKDGEKMLKIAYCESKLNTDAININSNGTIDRGILQLNSIHKNITNECAFNAKCNIDAGYQIYLKQGFKPWVCRNLI